MKAWILNIDGSLDFEYEVPKGAMDEDLLPAVPFMLSAPPSTSEHEKAYAINAGTDNEQWVIKPNFAGITYWMPDGSINVCEQSGVSLPEGASLSAPAPTLIEQFNDVRLVLQAEIDIKAQSLGFSGGNALMLYAGFPNAFNTMATQFAEWEASVWVEAETYKQEVIAGSSPMLSPEQAVAMMPTYPS